MHLSGELAAVCASLLWSINSVNFSMAGKRVGSPVVNHMRLWIALITLMIMHGVMFGSLFPTHTEHFRLQWLGLSGIIGFAIGDAAFFESLVLLGPRLSMTIITTNPVFASIGSMLILGERLTVLESIVIIVTIGAIAWVVSEPKTEQVNSAKSVHSDNVDKKKQMLGIMLALVGACCQGLGMLLSKMGMQEGFSPISANIIRVFVGTFVIFFITLFQGKLLHQLKMLKDIKAVGYIISGALFGPVMGVMMALYSVSHINVGIATTLTSLSPIFLIPISYFLFKEKITIRSVCGALIVIAGSSVLFFI